MTALWMRPTDYELSKELYMPGYEYKTPATSQERRMDATATKQQTDVSRITPPPASARDLLQTPAVLARFETVMGNPNKAAQFVASLASLVYASKALKECEPKTVIAAAIQAAALDLAIDANLGQAHIIPYGREARFQIGWKGYVQLALRTAQYAAINVDHVLEGEVEIINRFTGEVKVGPPKSSKVVGVMAYLKLLNGFEKYDFWTLEQIEAHAKKFSKSYGSAKSGWSTNPEAMQKKTVLLDLLRKYGVLSVEMRQAISVEAISDPDADELPLVSAEQRARDKAALFGVDEETGEIVDHKPTTAPDNATLDAAIVAAETAKKN